jgi:hypothetical protein
MGPGQSSIDTGIVGIGCPPSPPPPSPKEPPSFPKLPLLEPLPPPLDPPELLPPSKPDPALELPQATAIAAITKRSKQDFIAGLPDSKRANHTATDSECTWDQAKRTA